MPFYALFQIVEDEVLIMIPVLIFACFFPAALWWMGAKAAKAWLDRQNSKPGGVWQPWNTR